MSELQYAYENSCYEEEDSMTDNALVEQPHDNDVKPWDDGEGVALVLRQNQLVDELMSKAMEKDKHYGVIPGTGTKPSLLKPGAEALLRLFRLAPRYEITETSLGGDHFKLDIVCSLTHRVTGEFWGEGVATASTKESKWRWRYDETNTGKPVPKEYWAKRDNSLLGGKGFSPKKIDGAWVIVERGERIENPDIADQWNTVKKIGKKRALADAILSATGASAIFTQDVDEIGDAPESSSAKTPPKSSGKGSNSGSEPKADSGEWDGTKEVFFGKYSKEDPPKKWSEVPSKYLIWVTENMKPDGGPAHGMAVQEIARRAAQESGQQELPTEPEVIEGEVVDDSELEGRFA